MGGGKVFIAGPIQGMETRQGYRERLKKILSSYGYEPIDPWTREKILYRYTEDRWWAKVPPKGFIDRDLKDIERCDYLVAYLPRLSAGTCMELFYAKLKGKKTVVICKLRNPSPWITFHADILVRSFKELEEVLKLGIEKTMESSKISGSLTRTG